MKKRGFKELLKNNFISIVILISLICLGAVIAGNIIVKEGAIEMSENLTINSGAGIKINSDLGKIFFGESNDATIYYDGDNNQLIIDPKQSLPYAGTVKINKGGSTNPSLLIETNASAGRPNILYRARGVTGGVAYNLFKAEVENSALNNNTMGAIGVYGSANGSGIPYNYYLYLDSTPESNYNKALLKIADNEIGIGISGATTPIGGTLFINNTLTSNHALLLKKTYNQTGSMIRINNYDGTVLSTIDENGWIGIGVSDPIYPIEINAEYENLSIYTSGNISARGFVDRTSLYDKSKNVWDYIKDADYYKDENGEIDHKKYYGYVPGILARDYSRPVNEEYNEEVCDLIDNENGEQTENCHTETKTKVTYPHIKQEEGVSLGDEINLLRQAVYELKQDNEKLKDEICTINPNSEFC